MKYLLLRIKKYLRVYFKPTLEEALKDKEKEYLIKDKATLKYIEIERENLSEFIDKYPWILTLKIKDLDTYPYGPCTLYVNDAEESFALLAGFEIRKEK